MKTTIKLAGLGGWSVRCLSVAIAFAFCASAHADPNRNVVSLAKPAKKTKVCYTLISNSGIPQPCDRLGAIPTTASPLLVLGAHSGQERR